MNTGIIFGVMDVDDVMLGINSSVLKVLARDIVKAVCPLQCGLTIRCYYDYCGNIPTVKVTCYEVLDFDVVMAMRNTFYNWAQKYYAILIDEFYADIDYPEYIINFVYSYAASSDDDVIDIFDYSIDCNQFIV